MVLQGTYHDKVTCSRGSHWKCRYSFLTLEGGYPAVSCDNIRFLQADVASIWFLEHIIRVSNDYHVPADLVCLGKTQYHHGIKLIHWLVQSLVSDTMQTPALSWKKVFVDSSSSNPIYMFTNWHQVPLKCIFTREPCLKFQKMSVTSLGVIGLWMMIFWLQHQPLKNLWISFQAHVSSEWSKSSLNGMSCPECNFTRIHPTFETISLSAIEAEFLQRVTLGSHLDHESQFKCMRSYAARC